MKFYREIATTFFFRNNDTYPQRIECSRQTSLRKTVGKVSPILVTLTSRSDSNFERSNINLKENKRDDVDFNSNGFDYCVRKNEGKILWFSAD